MSDWKEIEEFRRFIRGVSADDFDRSSAIDTLPMETDFHGFREVNIATAAEVFHDHNGEVDPIIVLANETEQRVFEADDDETMLDLFRRMHREAERMEATMVFVAMRLYAARRVLSIDGLDSDAIRAAVERGDLVEHYSWYAEQSTPDGPHRLSGVWEIHETQEGEVLGARQDGSPELAPLFHQILNG